MDLATPTTQERSCRNSCRRLMLRNGYDASVRWLSRQGSFLDTYCASQLIEGHPEIPVIVNGDSSSAVSHLSRPLAPPRLRSCVVGGVCVRMGEVGEWTLLGI